MRANDAILAVCCCFSILCTCASESKCPGGWSVCPRYAVLGRLTTRDIEIRRYEGGLYLERISPSDTYGFTCAYAYFDLIGYFNGNNLHEKPQPKSTPLIVTVGRLHLKGMRKGRFYLGNVKGRVAAPFSPSSVVEMDPTTYYVRYINRTLDFTTILTHIDEMITDLTNLERPFDPSMAHVVHYEYPEGGDYSGPNEILVAKLTDELELYAYGALGSVGIDRTNWFGLFMEDPFYMAVQVEGRTTKKNGLWGVKNYIARMRKL